MHSETVKFTTIKFVHWQVLFLSLCILSGILSASWWPFAACSWAETCCSQLHNIWKLLRLTVNIPSSSVPAIITRTKNFLTAAMLLRYILHKVTVLLAVPIPLVAPSKTWVCGLSRAGDCGFESRHGSMDVCLLWAFCVVSASDRSLVQRSPAECRVSECDLRNLNNEEAVVNWGMLSHYNNIQGYS
jgi:hypothetical protein